MEPKDVFVKRHDARTHQDVTLHYVDWGGSGPPLILLHGGRMTSRTWDQVSKQLVRDFRVVAMDARGHGDSDKPLRGYSYFHRLEDLNGVLDSLGWEHAYGVAHSTGAMAMTCHAATHRGRLTKLTLIEPPARTGRGEAAQSEEGAQSARPPRPAASPAGVPSGGARPAGDGQRQRRGPAEQRREWPSRKDLEVYLKNHPETGKWRHDTIMDMVHYAVDEQPDGRVIMKWSPDFYNPEDGVLNTQNIFEECKKILVPTLLIYGTRGVAQEETSRALLAAWPQAELAIVRDSGHSVYMEDPDVCAGEIATFFKKPAAQKGAVREYQVRANARAG